MKFVSIKKVPPVEDEFLQMTDGRVRLGKRGEAAAASFLTNLGYTLLESNHRTRIGEADLILLDGDTLVFCEVKTKRSTSSGHALEAYGTKQQARMRRLILRYLQAKPWEGPVRVDLLGLQKAADSQHFEVNHIKDAISLEDSW